MGKIRKNLQGQPPEIALSRDKSFIKIHWNAKYPPSPLQILSVSFLEAGIALGGVIHNREML